ncbi:hypothetical protein G9A89_010230 [Geosiphon pyriformis]|nr:hypothetical protein G9A89_010230 [Geosiphon pyriformis]
MSFDSFLQDPLIREYLNTINSEEDPEEFLHTMKLLLNPPYALTLPFKQLIKPSSNPRRLNPPPRPANPFLIFRRNFMAKIKSSMSPTDILPPIGRISQLASESWKQQPLDVIDYFYSLANLAKKEHLRLYPDYIFNPKIRRGPPPMRTYKYAIKDTYIDSIENSQLKSNSTVQNTVNEKVPDLILESQKKTSHMDSILDEEETNNPNLHIHTHTHTPYPHFTNSPTHQTCNVEREIFNENLTEKSVSETYDSFNTDGFQMAFDSGEIDQRVEKSSILSNNVDEIDFNTPEFDHSLKNPFIPIKNDQNQNQNLEENTLGSLYIFSQLEYALYYISQ